MSSHPPLHAVDRALRAAPWFRPGARVLAAVSGGPDSMALLAAVADLPSVRVTAAHFDHRIRPESARDVETVRTFTDDRGIPVIAGSGDVPARAREGRVSIETAAREERYAFLREAAARAGADWIATGHTRSDHVETVLMRVLRGAGERGLAGIAREHHGIVRPLLDMTRADTIDYCARRGHPVAIDPSNHDRRFTRNAIRHDVLPALRRAFPGIDAALLRTSQLAAQTLRAARSVTEVRLARALSRDPDGAWVLSIEAFADLDAAAAAVLVGDALARMGCYDDIRETHYRAVLALTQTDAVGSSADLPGVHVRRDHDALVLRCRREAPAPRMTPAEVLLEIAGTATVNGWTVTASFDANGGHEVGQSGQSRRPSGHGAEPLPTRSGRGERGRALGRGARWGAETRVRVPRLVAASEGPVLIVRPPRPGDRVRPFGMRGTKKLSDILIDRKIPHRERARLVVIESNGEIVWVPGVVAAESTRVRDGDAPVVRLRASREAE